MFSVSSCSKSTYAYHDIQVFEQNLTTALIFLYYLDDRGRAFQEKLMGNLNTDRWFKGQKVLKGR